MSQNPRIAILGAGPAGCALAAMLARQDIQALVYDDEKRPEMLVGESLIPGIVQILQRMGIEDKVAAIAQFKPGASFIHHRGTQMHFDFRTVTGRLPPYAYNVPRPTFDDVIKDHARALGVRFVKHRAGLVAHPGGTPELELDAAALAAGGYPDGCKPDLIIDCSGRSRTSARLLGIGAETGPRRDTAHFAHFTGIDHPYPAGQIVITYHPWGWSWRIPLPDSLSFGMVMHPKSLSEFGASAEERLDQVLATDPTLAPLTAHRKRVSEAYTYTNYQLISDRAHGPGWVSAGDAFGFVDPMLSPGVFLALDAAESLNAMFARHGEKLLDQPQKLQQELGRYEQRQRGWHEAWHEFIEYFYDGRIVAFYERGTKLKADHPGAFSNMMERMSSRILALMASGATTASTFSRMYLKCCSKWLLIPGRAQDLALPKHT
ncbi:NAD(P)/FAD-dependent oxidoreductase [Prosthecobacter vanneervenii]|uniref:Flavin-dependent dehydrogenase n=1 Tax=Prosthecobacter vanneervenii TaxID=48466 RepID=A0A7W7YBR9_9BACT|nr:NAD(P)/FAD-dependent oxidoreductase [Prosthecobacter vanneervenii]MBB5033293.1 flavin-dependent dehydrogenase [Prosthecobacter vanneervenii]